MKRYIRFSGLVAVCLGALSLVAGYALGWTNSNAFLLSAAALVILGAVAHVYLQKKESKY